MLPPQADALTASTDLVTIGMGGNEDQVYDSLVVVCAQLAADHPDGSPCQDRFGASVANDIDRIEDAVLEVLEGIQELSPDAVVVLVGYPRLIPSSGTCEVSPFATGDLPWQNEMAARLDSVMSRAAERHGSWFVDLLASSPAEGVCAADPWVNGTQELIGQGWAGHPTPRGERAMAEAIYAEITGQPAPTA